jgi:hypothetical protein
MSLLAPARLLLVASAVALSAGGITACGSSELATDIEPARSPVLTAPTGDGSLAAAGAGDQADVVTDLPSSTTDTSPTPSAGDDGTDDHSSASGATSAPSSGGAATSTGSSSTGGAAAAGSGGTGGTATPSGTPTGTPTGTTPSTGGDSTDSGDSDSSSSSGGSSSGGSSPGEFGEFCDTNPGVCR